MRGCLASSSGSWAGSLNERLGRAPLVHIVCDRVVVLLLTRLTGLAVT